MKKFLTPLVLLGLLVAGCTDKEDLSGNNTAGNLTEAIDEATGYVTLNIIPTGRGRDAATDDKYEDGTPVENKINNIRFYFYDALKQPVQAKKNPDKSAAAGRDVYDSFYDYTMVGNEDGAGNSDQTVEKTLTVTLVLNIDSKNPPVYVVAVLNPTDDALVDGKTLAELSAIDSNFLPGAVNKDEDISNNPSYVGKFVMSNSVYADGTPKEAVNYTKITELCKTAEDALDPTKQTAIFVERVAARLDLTVGQTTGAKIQPATAANGFTGTDATNVYYTGQKHKLYNADADDEGQPIFVKFLKWQVTATPLKSYLIKNIEPTWDDNLFGSIGGTATEPWNIAALKRSFWAINPTLKGAADNTETATTDYQFYSYNQINLDFAAADEAATTYIHENAAAPGSTKVKPNHETKVIVAAQLLKPDGTPMTVVEYGFKYYEKDDFLQYIADQIWLYSSADKQEGTKISGTDLKFVTQYEYTGNAGVEVPGGYFTYLALATTGSTWYTEDGEQFAGDLDDLNRYINDHLDNRILLWDNGQTYYYFTVEHLGSGTPEEPGAGYYGVVRNHVYKADISNLVGLGTPVLNPNETIYPEKPSRDGSIFAANIKVLSWRIVAQDYELSW